MKKATHKHKVVASIIIKTFDRVCAISELAFISALFCNCKLHSSVSD